MTEIIKYENAPVQYMTGIKGWINGDGKYYGKDEHMARWSSCTHIQCKYCGDYVKKTWTACDSCRRVNDIIKYLRTPCKRWDGESMLYSETKGEYYTDPGHYRENCSDGDTVTSDRVFICEPIYLRQLDEDIWCDYLPEDGELPEDIKDAIAVFNAMIKQMPPQCWYPSKFAWNGI